MIVPAAHEGFKTIITIDKTNGRTNAVLSAPANEIEVRAKGITINPNLDYYITAQAHKVPRTWKATDLLGLQQIVVDIDLHHARPKEVAQTTEILIYALKQQEYNLPYTEIVNTGRGLHVILKLEQVSYVLEWLHRLVTNAIIKKYDLAIKDIIKEYNLTYKIKVERTNGLTRFKGSYNSISKTKVVTVAKNNRLYELNELVQDLNIIIGKRGAKGFKTAPKGLARPLAIRRILDIENIGIIPIGNRNKIAYLYYNNLIIYMDPAEAEALLNKFNKSNLEQPLRQNEINAIVRFINRVGHYRFTNETFYEWLGTDKPITRQDQRNARRKEKAEQTNRIIELLSTTSKTQQEIAQLVGVSRRTVARIIKDKGISLNVRKQRLQGAKQTYSP